MVYQVESATLINALCAAKGKKGLITNTYIERPSVLQRVIKWMVR